jgi:hypothetical protein
MSLAGLRLTQKKIAVRDGRRSRTWTQETNSFKFRHCESQTRNLKELRAFGSRPTGERGPPASGREKAKNSFEKTVQSRCRKGAKQRNATAKRLQNREEQIIGTRDKSQCLVAQRLLSHLQYPDAAKSSIKDLSLPPFNLKSS